MTTRTLPVSTLESHQDHNRLEPGDGKVVTNDGGLHPELSNDPNYSISQIDGERPTTSSAADSELAWHNTTVTQDQGSSRSGSLILEKNPPPGMQMPDKKYTRFLRNLRWTIFSVYRRLNALVLTANIIAIIVLATQHKLVSMSPDRAATAVSINLVVSVLMRQELVINTLFWTFGKCPQWFPLRIRRLSAKIYHLGGVHSGAAMSATLWFAFFNVSIVNSFQSGRVQRNQSSIPIITVILDVLLLSIIAMAHPAIRARMHNQFELVHRFAGWTAVGLFWVEFALLADAKVHDAYSPEQAGQIVLKSPIFWTLLVATISIALPWVWLRKVKVNAEHLSDHAIRLHFTYTKLPLCAAPRISDSPLLEWHAFAGIPDEDGPGFSVLVSRAGDWTSRLIRSPPTTLWVRGIPTLGVLHVAPIFRKLVLVATGSGIGPILSLLSKRDVCCRILWSTPAPEVTYSKNVIETVLRADPEAMIINTTLSGRPDLVKHTYDLYVKSDAEAVFVISNPRVTRRVVYSLESRGIPVFAP
jgi:hypothetical protein